MNHAIIVAGGIGTRMHLDMPKQYYQVKGIPIIMYSFRKFASHPQIDTIVIVLADEWRDFVDGFVQKESFHGKVLYAKAGISRQHSVLSGLKALEGIAGEQDVVLVHDSVRPLFQVSSIDDGIQACSEFKAAIPVITVKDATYQSIDGVMLSAILPRDQLFSGQSPEAFVYGPYLRAHNLFSEDEISQIRGSSELAFRAGLSVRLIPGTEQNYKLTTIEDLRAFELTLQ